MLTKEFCVINQTKCCSLDCQCDFNCCDEDITTIKNFTSIIRQKWAVQILNTLNKDNYGFNELFHILQNCNRKVLSETLLNLLSKKVIGKWVFNKNNITYSQYYLTTSGYELVNLLFLIKSFSCRYLNE